ncbi:MAG TPA: GNAT family protein [Dehalococcoidia bacterium]|nr:GNAT family protein [Dehalococcoidia bacterium]
MIERIELRTERLLLRPYRFDDVEDELVYRSDPEFARYLYHLPQPFTRRHAEGMVAVNVSEPWEKYQTFAVVLARRVIGTVNLEQDAENRIAMLGYAIGRDYWGKGIAPEAARALIDWGFETFKLAKIWASTDARHERSWRVMEKLGMRREGLLRSHSLARGERHDSVHYGLLREEWEALRRYGP